MKKRILAMLLVILLIALCGCSEQRPNDDTQTMAPTVDLSGQFTVGYGRVNITPEESVPLAGAGNTSQRMSTGTLTYLYSTCIAITDTQGETVLLFSNVILVAWTATFTELRKAISEATGVPVKVITGGGSSDYNTVLKSEMQSGREPDIFVIEGPTHYDMWADKIATMNDAEWTQYTSCCNVDKGIYYYTTYDNHQITGVDMHAENLDGTELSRFALIQGEQIRMQNKNSLTSMV